MSTEGMQMAFRIAIRREGPWINAYWAKLDSLEDAFPIASINRRICDMDPKIFDAWVALLKVAADTVSRVLLGEGVTAFTEERVPPEERDK